MSLSHNHPDCTGLWDQELIGTWLFWRCHRCGAIAYPSDTVAEAAIRENQLGMTLRQLANAGEWLNLSDDEEQWRS